MNTLSIVNVAPESTAGLINELAEILGMGVDNLSIKLQNQNGDIYYGCHSWWTVEKYISFKDLSRLSKLGVDVDRFKPALATLFESIRNSVDMTQEEVNQTPILNWEQSLIDLQLTVQSED